MIFNPHDYQKRAIEKIVETPAVGLFLEMGLGKTVIALSAVEELIYEDFDVSRVLVIAPLKVAEDTWSRESEKWDHLQNLRIAKILGNAKTRQKAAESDADVYVINRENVVWLVEHYLSEWKWDMLIIDELSSFKSNQTARFKALRKARPKVKRVVGLTGTPNPNGLMDLWAEIYLLDQGQRLGRFIGRYRDAFFKPGMANGYVTYNWVPLKGAGEQIAKRIEDITVSMSAEDYLKLPERIDNKIIVELSKDSWKKYKELEKNHVLELFGDDGAMISATNAAAVMNKLLQLSGGAIYDDEGGWVEVHKEKLKALEDIIDTNDEPILVFYGFKHERERLLEELGGYEPRELRTSEDIDDWNAGKVRILLAHPASVGYGLNLQNGGRTIVWYSMPWSLELYQQANARLYRQGQTRPVIINHLIAKGTVDEDVAQALEDKNTGQAALMAALKEKREEAENDGNGK